MSVFYRCDNCGEEFNPQNKATGCIVIQNKYEGSGYWGGYDTRQMCQKCFKKIVGLINKSRKVTFEQE